MQPEKFVPTVDGWIKRDPSTGRECRPIVGVKGRQAELYSKGNQVKKETHTVPTRILPIERVRVDIDALFASDRDLGEVVE